MGHLDIIQKLWEWAKKNLTTVEINNKLLLATDKLGKNGVENGSNEGKINIKQKLWKWAKENLTPE